MSELRLGLIARADSRGLGVQCKGFHDAMRPARTMVVDCPSANPLPMRFDWYPDATWIKGLPTARDFRTWLDGIDVVYSAETGYSRSLWSEAERAGVKTVLHLNREFLDPLDSPTLWAAPSMWRYNEVPDRKVFLPVPIEADRFAHISQDGKTHAKHFLHIVGRPAVHDRNGTGDLLAALAHVRSDITVTIKCQDDHYVADLAKQHRMPANVHIVIDTGDVTDYWRNYEQADVLVMPRRFGGLCLPVNEALGAGQPVIMPDIDPNNTWLPQDWLVPAAMQGQFRAKTSIDLYTVDHRALAAKIDRFATDAAFYAESRSTAEILAKGLSWENMRPEYDRVLSALVR